LPLGQQVIYDQSALLRSLSWAVHNLSKPLPKRSVVVDLRKSKIIKWEPAHLAQGIHYRKLSRLDTIQQRT
jgi:hypothetical protein